MKNSFSINWGTVADSGDFPTGWQLYALWPAPVNDDVCFKAAGYNNFQSDDENYSEAYWDEQAEILHLRIIEVLSGLGETVLLSKPLLGKRILSKFWKPRDSLPLAEQLNWPVCHDSLPPARVRFGEVAELSVGNGHRLYWIGLSPESPLNFTAVLLAVAKGWPRRCIQLDWNKL